MNNQPHKQQGRTAILALIGMIALVVGIWSALQLRQPPPPPVLSHSTTWLNQPRPLQAFELVDHKGQPFTLERLRGTWTFMFFGYTHCPDVCPTTMTSLNGVSREFAKLQGRVPAAQFAFVSIDPERDSVDQLARFVPYFNPDFLGVTGTLDSIDALTKQLSIMYLKVEENRPGGYLMDHSAAVLLVDPQARFHALFSAPLDPLSIARDFQQIGLYYEALQ